METQLFPAPTEPCVWIAVVCRSHTDADASSSYKAPAKMRKGPGGRRSHMRWPITLQKICTSFIPLGKESWFIEMLQTNYLKYQLPSRKHFAAVNATAAKCLRPNLYNKTRPSAAEQLQNRDYYSITTIFGPNESHTHLYWNLAAHFVGWELSLCLRTSYFPDDKTGIAIAPGLQQDSLASWKLREVLFAWLQTAAPSWSKPWEWLSGPTSNALDTFLKSNWTQTRFFIIIIFFPW